MEPEQRLRPVPIVDQPVEGREERDAVGNGAVERVRMRLPAPGRGAHAEGTKAPLRDRALGVPQRQRAGVREDALAEIPETLPARSPRDCDLPTQVERGEHEPDVAGAVPPTLLLRAERAVLELPREQRPAPLQLAEDVATKGAVLVQEVAHPALGLVVRRGSPAAHETPHDGKLLDRPDEGIPLEERALVPQQAVELRHVVRAQSAPEDEVLCGRHGRDRVELQEPEPADGLEHVRRGPVEELRPDGDTAGLGLVDQPPSAGAPRAAEPDGLRHGGRPAQARGTRRPTRTSSAPTHSASSRSAPTTSGPASAGAPRSAHTPSTRSTLAVRSNVASTRPISSVPCSSGRT